MTPDEQFTQSEIERRLKDLETKISQYEQGGFDLFRQFGYLQLGVNLPRLDKNGIQILTQASAKNAIFFFDDHFQVDPNNPSNPSGTPYSALVGAIGRALSPPLGQLSMDAFAGTATAELTTIARDDTNDHAKTQSYVNVGSDIATVAHDMDGGRTFAQLILSNTVLEVASFASDPGTLNNGDIWYNSTGNVFKVRANGATVTLGSGVATDAIWDAKGDLAVGTGADTAQKLSLGASNQFLVADSTQTVGMKWADFLTYTAQSAGYSAARRDLVNYTGVGGHTITLPAAGASGTIIVVKNSGTGGVTVDGNASELIDGSLTIAVGVGESVTLFDTGTGWVIT